MAPTTCTLQRYLKSSASYFDVSADQPERFYHGFVLGLIAGLQDTHIVHSNRESGDGGYDVALLPRAGGGPERPGIRMEFKQMDEPTSVTVSG